MESQALSPSLLLQQHLNQRDGLTLFWTCEEGSVCTQVQSSGTAKMLSPSCIPANACHQSSHRTCPSQSYVPTDICYRFWSGLGLFMKTLIPDIFTHQKSFFDPAPYEVGNFDMMATIHLLS